MRHVLTWAMVGAVWVGSGPSLADEPENRPPVPQSSVTAENDGAGAGGSEHMSVLSGRTVGLGTLVLHPEFGWPGLSASLFYGVMPHFDVGGALTFNYGYEGQLFIIPGLKFQGVFRLGLYDDGKINLGLRFDPGIALYFDAAGDAAFHVLFPLYFVLGIQASETVMVIVGMDLPMFVDVTDAYLNIPILFGPGLEFKLDRNLLLTFNTRFGPAIYAGSLSRTAFEFKFLMGIAVKL